MGKEHFKVCDVILTACSPVFVGSGQKVFKKDYTFSMEDYMVNVYEPGLLLEIVQEEGLIDEYESFIFQESQGLEEFFASHPNVAEKAVQKALRYRTGGGDVLYEGKPPQDIFEFMRNGSGAPYIPGSSLKGVLRTVLLTKAILDEGNLLTADDIDENKKTVTIENDFLSRLKSKKQQSDSTSSIMRGFSVSDSLPLSNEDLILAKKWDYSTGGTFNDLNVARECLKPGTAIRFKLKLDSFICGKIDANYLKSALEASWSYYHDTYLSKFQLPREAADIPSGPISVIGGGSGYFSKNIVYPLLGSKEGLKYVSSFMKNKFKSHHHEKSISYGIAPHMLKMTMYGGRYHHMGLCSVRVLEEEQ